MSPLKICIIYNSLLPYHYARLLALGQLVPNLLVIEVSDRSEVYGLNLKKNDRTLKKEILFPGRTLENIPGLVVKKAIRDTLAQYKPEVVITAGYRDPAAQASAKWAKENGLKTILMLESWIGDKRRWWLKEKAKEWFVQRWFDGAFVGGWRHYLYALSLGFHPRHIWRGVDVVDNEYFKVNSIKIRKQEADLRSQHELPARYFLCVARHSAEKNLKGLLKAYRLYRQHGNDWSLVLVGDGPQRMELERGVKSCQLDSVIFTGWVQYEKLPIYYGMANAFILPSISEPWGLVVNEAMASGLPILISERCGSLPELCWRGINGYVFDPYNVDEIVEAMAAISSNIEKCVSMGKASEEIIATFTPKRWAEILVSCFENLDSHGN